MVKDTKLYDILELSPNATDDDIQKQYKLLAKKWHPDKNKDRLEEATKKTQELNEAKEILLNPEKRKLYDQFGLDMANGNAAAGPNPEDLFNMFGGGFSGFGGRREPEKENIVIQQEVTLEQIYNEHNIRINFKQKNCCEKCGGNINKCNHCDGKGVRIQIIQMGPMIQQVQSTCGNCRGSGKIANPNSCSDCRGEGWKLKDVSINVPLKNGLSNGQQIHLQNMGHNLKEGKTDVIVVIQEKEHNIFKRDGNNLIVDIELKLFQAMFGFDKVITHLDGRNLHLSHTGVTNYETKRKIFGEGITDLRTKQKGDLIINFKFKLPIITKPDIIQNLQYNLKSIDQEESNKEVEIRVNNSKYSKTVMTDYKESESREPKTPFQTGTRVNVEGGAPECVQQ
jgi:DnaJ family protein A protein 2